MSKLNSETIEKNEAEQKISVPVLLEQDTFFDTEYLKADLKGRSVRGGAVTVAGQEAKKTWGVSKSDDIHWPSLRRLITAKPPLSGVRYDL